MVDKNEGERRCGKCGVAMRCTHLTDHYRGWMYLGATYRHRCTGCNQEIRTLSAWKAIFDLSLIGSIALACLGGGVLMVFDLASRALGGAPAPAAMWGAPVVIGAFGLLCAGFAAWTALGVVNRFRNPLLR
jgi:hypothetical protein